MVPRSRLVKSFKLCMTKKSSNKGFFNALVCVKGRLWAMVIHQHKFTKAGAVIDLCFWLVSDFSWLFLYRQQLWSTKQWGVSEICDQKLKFSKGEILNYLLKFPCMLLHEYQGFHKGRGKKARLWRQPCDSPIISYLKHCKTSLVISLLLFHGLINPGPIRPSHPALISTPSIPQIYVSNI